MERIAGGLGAGIATGWGLALMLGLVALEFGYGLWRGRNTYDARETAATAAILVGHRLLQSVVAGIAVVPMLLAWEHRLFDIRLDRAWAALALFLAVEFVYYWHHRAMHGVRWFWASHAVHHSARHFNLSAGLRLGWFASLTGNFVFYLPLAFLGFHPAGIFGALALNLFYQFFLHTEYLPKLGPLEWVLNTPTHHRVHHACNEACLDRNFGGVLILYDRLFGSFAEAPKDEVLRYGVKDARVASHRPLRLELIGWIAMARDLGHARSLTAAGRALFGRP